MTNLEKYHKVLKSNLGVTEEEMNDDVMVYARHPKWSSMRHMDMVSELEEKFGVQFETLDITSFNTYSAGLNILRKLGVDI